MIKGEPNKEKEALKVLKPNHNPKMKVWYFKELAAPPSLDYEETKTESKE